jgi:transcriptional regulator with XRE-family HTH domain
MTGPQIRRERRRLGLTQAGLGALVGTDGTQISRWEAGTYTPSDEAQARLRAAFDGTPIETPILSRVRILEEQMARVLAMLPSADRRNVS